MKLAIMQPYLFPYIGYFQLINAVNIFVVYDDVNYIKQGWINRNRILLNGNAHLFTLNLVNASSFKSINEIAVGDNKNKLLKTIVQAYSKAPFFASVIPVINKILSSKDECLSRFIENSIRYLCDYINVNTEIVVSSSLKKNNLLKSQDKVLDICVLLNADMYINSIGGQALYSKEVFSAQGVEIKFLKTRPLEYAQFGNKFVPSLSILDVMMFNSPEVIGGILKQYELL